MHLNCREQYGRTSEALDPRLRLLRQRLQSRTEIFIDHPFEERVKKKKTENESENQDNIQNEKRKRKVCEDKAKGKKFDIYKEEILILAR